MICNDCRDRVQKRVEIIFYYPIQQIKSVTLLPDRSLYMQTWSSTVLCFVLCTDLLQSAPKIKDLLNKVAARANEKWKSVGLQLDMELPELNTIEDRINQANLCYAEMFQLWKTKGDPPFTWGTIIDALKAPSVGETQLATELQDWLCKQWM